jgi:RNA-directed DNA polymerase
LRKRVKDLAFAIRIPKKKLIEISSELDQDETQLYRNWDEPKTDAEGNARIENGQPLTRPINAPVNKLKYIQSQILKNVLYKIKLPDYFYGGIKGKDAVLNARHHQGNKFFFLTDLKDFYPSIHYTKVEQALRKHGFYPDVARLITRLCTTKGAIPQGCPTSSFLSSLVLYNVAGDLFEQYMQEGLKLSIYVDDLTLSSSVDFKHRTNSILNDLRQRDLKVNFGKTYYKTQNPLVTGVVVKNNGISALPHNYTRSHEITRTEASRKGYLMRIAYIKRLAKKIVS